MQNYDGGVVADHATGRPLMGQPVKIFDEETDAPVQAYREGQPVTLVTGAHGLIDQFQTEDTTRRVRMEVGPVRLRQWSQEMIASAADASGSISSALEQVEKFAVLENGTDLSLVGRGVYAVISASSAATMLNRPVEGIAAQAATLEVRSGNLSGTTLVQRWRIIPNAADPALAWTRHKDSAGNWSRWTVEQGGFVLKQGVDVRALHPGVYAIQSHSVASTLVNRPTDGTAWQSGRLIVEGAGDQIPRILRWQIAPSAADPSLEWTCHRDTGGLWSRWVESSEGITLAAGANILGLRPGRYIVPTYGVASTLVNRPDGAFVWGQNPSVIDVVGNDKNTKAITLTTAPAAAERSRTLRRHRDNGGSWSPWYEVITAAPPAPTGEAALPTLAPLAEVQHQHLRGMTRLAMNAEPVTHPGRYTAPAGSRLTTPTPDGSGQTVHPKVLDTITGWGGHRYWMAHTPYPFADDSKEDPCILVSADGTTWTTPAGLTNPLDDQPGTPDFYNSDTHLVLHEGTMHLIWRTSRTSPQIEDEISWRTSTDGTTWTPKHTLYRSAAPGTVYGQMLSPALLKTSTGWRMYLVAANADPNRLVYVDTPVTTPGPADWSAPVRCHFGSPGKDQFILGRDVWHIDVIQDGTAYWALLNDCAQRTGGIHGDLYLARSEDGVAWEVGPVPLLPRYGAGHDALYRGSLIKSGAGFDITYSARVSQNQRFHLYRTTAARDI